MSGDGLENLYLEDGRSDKDYKEGKLLGWELEYYESFHNIKPYKSRIQWKRFDEWKPEGVERVLAYTPDNKDIEYRIMPLFMALKSTNEFTHWAYLTPPEE